MKSEMCKKCIHTNVCFKDKNVCGDVFVPGNPMIFDNNELYRKYEERKKQGFPCNDYFPVVVRCKDCKHYIFDGDRFLCKALSNNYEPVVCLDDEGFCSKGEKVTE